MAGNYVCRCQGWEDSWTLTPEAILRFVGSFQ